MTGQQVNLTCNINSEGETIQWVGPDGSIIRSGGGFLIEDNSSPGNTVSVLIISNLNDSHSGNYICRTTTLPDVPVQITVRQGVVTAVVY